MFEIINNLSKYLFLIYIYLFLFQSFIIIQNNRKVISINLKKALFTQKMLIILFHITAFFVLSYNPTFKTFDKSIFSFFILSLLFISLGIFIYSKIFKNSCSLIWNGIFFIMSIGIVMLYRLNIYLAKKQLLWFLIGFIVAIIINFTLKILPNLSLFKYIYLILSIFLFIFTIMFGSQANGAKNWISIGNITFQPSEIVKIFFVFYLSCCFSKQNLKIKDIIFPTIMSALFIFFLIFQTDLGSGLIFFMTYLVMLYIRTSKFFVLPLGAFLITISSVFVYNFFGHIKIRFDTWINPWIDIQSKGYQISQSLFAIGSWGLLGIGLKNGFPNYIPIVEKDFIFAAICEEFGILFAIGLIFIFITIFFQSVKISILSKNNFLTLIASGLTSLMCFQSFLIIGGVTNLIPLTGVTLPFVSYGGSSIIISFIIISILQWISTTNNSTKYI